MIDISSNPQTFVDTSQNYSYTLQPELQSLDPNFNYTISATLENDDPLPEWLDFSNNTQILSGVPSLAENGASYNIKLTPIDPSGNITSPSQIFTLTVYNSAPNIIANPVITAVVNQEYRYVMSTDVSDNTMTYIENIPDWLSVTDITGGNKIYSGTPTSITDQNSFEIIPVNDVNGLNYSQKFTISIIEPLSNIFLSRSGRI